jgi:hypothetical protein
MRFSLFDLFIAAAVTSLGFQVGLGLARLAGPEPVWRLLALAFALIAYFLLTPFIYRRLHLRALSVPLCPHCQDRNRHYWYESPRFDWPRDVVICSNCKVALELWYERPQEADMSAVMPAFQILWPQSWGRWQLINRNFQMRWILW